VAFLPFYIPKQKRLRVVIVGGGYAGMAALTVLSRYAPDTEVTVIDPNEQHIKMTHLHETFRYPLSDLQVSFTDLSKRFGFHFIQAALPLNETVLQQWQADRSLTLNEEVLHFDYLLITTGGGNKGNEPAKAVMSLQDFMTNSGSDLLSDKLAQNKTDSEPVISVIGGGATGIQFLFEIKQFLHRKKIKSKLRLIHSRERLLEQFPDGFHIYVESRLRELNIEFYPNTYYCKQQDNKILLRDKKSQEEFVLPSHLTLLFLGKKQENLYEANAFGQVLVEQKTLENIFVAGDCSHFNSFGSNSLSAQSAVRKGKLVARNILRHSSVLNFLEPYLHHELGYVVSLGHADAVGWLASEGNVITGLPALAIKELVESQYDLLLMGIDTYLV